MTTYDKRKKEREKEKKGQLIARTKWKKKVYN